MAAHRKRGQNEGTISKRNDGRWEARLTYYEGAKRRRKCFYGKTRREVQERLTGALRDQQRGLPVNPENERVGAYLERWLTDSAAGAVRPRTLESYRFYVERHIVPDLGRESLFKLTPQRVQAWMSAKLASGLAPRTVQYQRAILRRALNQAMRWGLVSRNVATLVDPPRQDKKEVQPWSVDQARVFLTAVRGDRLEALFTAAVALGLREGEALGLRWDDIDLDRGELRVRQTLVRLHEVGADGKRHQKLVFSEPKTEPSKRTLNLPAFATTALRHHRARQLEERLFAGSRWREHGLVFTTSIGTPIDPSNVIHRFHKLADAADLPRRRFHDLRHTCASLLLAQGADLRLIMEVLGHSQISLTANLYTHVMPALKEDAAVRMNAIMTAG